MRYASLIFVVISLIGVSPVDGMSPSVDSASARIPLYLSPRIDTTDVTTEKLISLVESYVSNLDNDSSSIPFRNNNYLELDVARVVRGLLLPALGAHDYQWQPILLSIDSQASTYDMLLAYTSVAGYREQSIWAIQHLRAAFRENMPFLVSPSPPLLVRQFDSITYLSTASMSFDSLKADSAVSFVQCIFKMFPFLENHAFKYIVGSSQTELGAIIGLPFALNLPSGFNFAESHEIYTSSGSVCYKHELVHECFASVAKVSSKFALEGVATWLGGESFSTPTLKKSIRANENLLMSTDSVRILDVISSEWHQGAKDLFYLCGGMVSSLIYEADGPLGIKTLLHEPTTEIPGLICKQLGPNILTVGDIYRLYCLSTEQLCPQCP